MNLLFHYFIFFTFYLKSVTGLDCYFCWYNVSNRENLELNYRLEVSPNNCFNPGFCEGQWCIQRLDGNNVSFSCALSSPLDYIFDSNDIKSQCQGYYDSVGVAHTACYCRGSSYCNQASNFNLNIILLTVLTIFTFLD
uniref:Protein sleepless n=1 Tax=Panagrolaimus sp. JU765 TaxID=591449 RepID=A0AC34R5K3_9BILA